ncbi:ABC transporter ATP-binding protein [Planomicrobium sp. CPCC 101110]|uniref:ABC transporter ATP-binding protein n=1 Tax=Planomicrobium sp. CPCC 101110 TaxID=2599619 RepID=UPI0011B5A821|nr:ABC transporter ATP-binding protein [Planomicrobium sp. CPCC 101110]TWT25751.1 ABC transporter ATP-binding protein [Planomicrobium sp. CPCC 101110]
MNAIETVSLTKHYGNKPVVDNIDLVVPKGSIYGFIGRNGSGKTTTQKMISGLARPTSGSIKLFGKSVESQDVRDQIGVLIEEPALFAELSAYENLILQGHNTGIKNPKEQAKKSLELVDLTKAANKKAKQLSLGMRQRLGVAVAMMASPNLLILDEPINGLDPEGIIEMRGVFERLNKEMGITIFISSHILGELSRIATHYGILHDGKLIQQLSAKELAEKSRDYLQIRVSDSQEAHRLIMEKMNPTECTVLEDSVRVFGVDNSRAVNEMLWKNGLAVDEIYRHQQDLEEYFLAQMGGFQLA